jgi:hypothetical protein
MKISAALELLKGGTIPLLVAVVGVAGGVIGTLLGSHLTVQHQTAKDITDRRVAVYKKFFEGQAKLLQSRSPNSEDKKKLTEEYEQEIKEARFEIGVFASPEVIQAMVDLFGILDKPDQKNDDVWHADVNIYQAMREIFG